MYAPRVRDTLLPRGAAYYTCVSVDPELPGGFLTECGVFGSNTLGHRAAAIDGNVHGYVLIELPSGALETEIDIIRADRRFGISDQERPLRGNVRE